MENVRKHRDVKIWNNRKNYLVSEANDHTTNFRHIISHRNKKENTDTLE